MEKKKRKREKKAKRINFDVQNSPEKANGVNCYGYVNDLSNYKPKIDAGLASFTSTTSELSNSIFFFFPASNFLAPS